jgi:DNA-binding transcriptional regulator YhcF (GntR family)
VKVEARRAALGEHAIFSVRVAAELLPGSIRENLEDLERAGIVYTWRGQRVVVWGDVVRMVRGDALALETAALPTPPQGGRLVRARDLPRPASL